MKNIKTIFQLIVFTITLLFAASCTKIYYVGQSTEPLKVYSTPDTTSYVYYTIPASENVLIQEKKKRYQHIVYQSYNGYVYEPAYINYHKYNPNIDGILYGYSTSKIKLGNTSLESSGTIHVKGYYRKDGTYVKPYTRSAPTKRH